MMIKTNQNFEFIQQQSLPLSTLYVGQWYDKKRKIEKKSKKSVKNKENMYTFKLKNNKS